MKLYPCSDREVHFDFSEYSACICIFPFEAGFSLPRIFGNKKYIVDNYYFIGNKFEVNTILAYRIGSNRISVT